MKSRKLRLLTAFVSNLLGATVGEAFEARVVLKASGDPVVGAEVSVMTTNVTQITHEPNVGWYPVWSPDGAKLALFVSSGLHVMGADGSGDRAVGNASSMFGSGISWRRAPVAAPSGSAQSRARQ